MTDPTFVDAIDVVTLFHHCFLRCIVDVLSFSLYTFVISEVEHSPTMERLNSLSVCCSDSLDSILEIACWYFLCH